LGAHRGNAYPAGSLRRNWATKRLLYERAPFSVTLGHMKSICGWFSSLALEDVAFVGSCIFVLQVDI
jgi:hypothetical protein